MYSLSGMVLRANIYFPIHLLGCFYNRNGVYLMCGMNCKCNLPHFRRLLAGISPWIAGFEVSPREICGGRNGNGTGLSPSSSAFPHLHHAPYYLHLQDKRAKPGNLPKSHARFVNRRASDRKAPSSSLRRQ